MKVGQLYLVCNNVQADALAVIYSTASQFANRMGGQRARFDELTPRQEQAEIVRFSIEDDGDTVHIWADFF